MLACSTIFNLRIVDTLTTYVLRVPSFLLRRQFSQDPWLVDGLVLKRMKSLGKLSITA